MKRKPFTTLMNPKVAKDLKKTAEKKGMLLYAVLEEAILDYLEKQKNENN